jgi:hypothetical protein
MADLNALWRTDSAERRLQTERKRLEIERERLAEDERSHQIPVEFFSAPEEMQTRVGAALRSGDLRQMKVTPAGSTAPAGGISGPACSPDRTKSGQIKVNQPSRSFVTARGNATASPIAVRGRAIRAGPSLSDRKCQGNPRPTPGICLEDIDSVQGFATASRCHG